jgi:DNA-binding NarL/FixJ family response regulator
LTLCTEEGRTLEAIRGGARGYLFKDDLGRGLEPALNEAFAGGAPMSRPVARLLLEELQRQLPPASELRPALTDRERQVIEQLARGLSYEQVALVLEISTNTVRSYVRTIYDKLCVSSKTEAVLAAVRLGIIAAAG